MSDDKIIIDSEDDYTQEETAVKKKTIRVLAFSLGGENYCVSVSQAKEVIELSDITRVPNTPEFIIGIINLRGEIVTILDIRYFFGLSNQERAKDVRILITDITGSYVGVLVDKIKDIIDIEEEAIQPPLATLKGKLADYTKGQVQLGKEILIFLDLAKVLNSEEINKLRK